MAARLELTGRYAEALKKADGALRISYLHDLRDMRISALNAQESIYRNLGEGASAKAVKEHISELKDSLQAYLIIDDVMHLSNIRQQRAMERRVIAAEYRERTVLYTCIILAVLLIVLAVFVILLRRKTARYGVGRSICSTVCVCWPANLPRALKRYCLRRKTPTSARKTALAKLSPSRKGRRMRPRPCRQRR